MNSLSRSQGPLLRYYLNSGILVGLTTCKMQSAGYTGGPVNIEAVSFPGDTGESIFQIRRGESREVYYCGWWDLNPRPRKPIVLPSTPFVKELED